MNFSNLQVIFTTSLLLLNACSEKAATVDVAADTAELADVAVDAAPAPGPPTPAARGWAKKRTIVHVHSAYSHDACDGEITKTGKANPVCLQQLRDALCASGLDVAFMTDHPAHMKEYTFAELLQVDLKQGDSPVGNPPVANILHCKALPEMPAHDVVMTVGYEGTHNMPVGLASHFTQIQYEGTSIADATTLSEARASIDNAHAVGGLCVNAHSEEDDISVQRLVDVGVDAMEIYNTHANFKTIVGFSAKGAKGDISRVFDLDAFVGPADKAPESDLVLLIMLDLQPEAAFRKWQQVLAQRHVTGVVGSDVHQNVVLDGLCTPGGQIEGLCDGLEGEYPDLVKMLRKGGPVILGDGQRIDDYRRVLRWVSNHVWLPAETAPEHMVEAMKIALKQGRSWAVYDVLGWPKDLDFVAENAGKWIDMGGETPIGSSLWLRTPAEVQPTPWAKWTAADTQKAGNEPQVQTLVWRIAQGADKAELVKTVDGFGQLVEIKAALPGQYHAEVRLKPRHLRTLLKGIGGRSDAQERWAVGNPILVK